ncbi:aspartic peptidase domain-containing protein [Baffinella frigidus]|nr:aspartic peptidase domain-containing protein [Cryptophyta sp. CCMP2293]
MGMPEAALPQIPTPLVFALANDKGGIEGANYINEHPLRERKFAFLSTQDSAELQLGGYDRSSTNADMVYIPTTSTTEYSVNVQSLTFGGIELLNWVDKTRPNAVPAIMDTGTTCLVIPDTLIEGRVSEKPYSKFKSIMTKGMSFYITIDGHLFEIPFSAWWQASNNAPCVQRAPASYAGLLLGDVLFQSLVVEFDLTKPSHPIIGIAPRNPLYTPAPPGGQDSLKLPVIKMSKGGVEVFDPRERDSKKGIDHVPVSMDAAKTQYFVNISVG